jgi:CubicO group peptidase (beta-lactamase class C family)
MIRGAFRYHSAMLKPLCVVVLGVGLACCSPAPSSMTDVRPTWPTKGWPSSTPEAEGLDPSALAALDGEFASGSRGQITGMLVIRHGRVVFEKSYAHDFDKLFEGRDPVRGPYNYYDPDWHPFYRHGKLHTMQSVSKSVTAALVGIAIGRGELPAVSTEVVPMFDGFRPSDTDTRRTEMTLEHVLTMTTGIKWDESTVTYTDPANSCANMEKSRDWIQFVLDQPMADAPGAKFVYNSGATELLSYLIKKGTGKQAHEYAAEHLFGPLGITDTYWKTTPTGLADTEGGLYLSARDLAKIGYLYLHDGVWDGRRLLPEGWVQASTSPKVDTRPGVERSRKYGYQWWVLPYGTAGRHAYAALGYGGQRLIVVPEHDLIAVFTGWNIYESPEFAPYDALDRVLAAVR